MFQECFDTGDLKTVEAYRKFKKWFSMSGKKYYEIQSRKEDASDVKDKLFCTIELAKMWVASSYEKTPSFFNYLEEALSLTVKLESENALLDVDYLNKCLTITENNTQLKINTEGTVWKTI